jgi:hypothetical protein
VILYSKHGGMPKNENSRKQATDEKSYEGKDVSSSAKSESVIDAKAPL